MGAKAAAEATTAAKATVRMFSVFRLSLRNAVLEMM
jgi:hypothetical protein